jgi:hypothetical protein
MAEPGIHAVHRSMFITGAMAYLSAPLWLAFLTLGTALWLSGTSLVEHWLAMPMELAGLWLWTLCLLFLPRALGIAAVAMRREQNQYGGVGGLIKSAVLESAMAVIFHHRKADHKRHFLVSVAMPYVYILCLCVGLLLVTLVSGALQLVGRESVDLLGRSWSLSGISGLLLYLLGLGGEIFMLTSLYLVMPAGRMSLRHALLGGVTAALLWELTRRVLIWYFSTLSQVNVVYGSLTTAIVVLLSLEIAATLVLLGAQVIANYERLDRTGSAKPPKGELSGEPVESLRPDESLRR